MEEKTSIERGASSSPLGGTLSRSDKSDPGPSPRAHEHGRQHRANIPRLYFEQNKRNWGPTRRQWVLEFIVNVLIYSPRVCSFRVSCRLWSLWWVLGRRLETQWTLPWALLYLFKDVSCCLVIVPYIWYRFSLWPAVFFFLSTLLKLAAKARLSVPFTLYYVFYIFNICLFGWRSRLLSFPSYHISSMW